MNRKLMTDIFKVFPLQECSQIETCARCLRYQIGVGQGWPIKDDTTLTDEEALCSVKRQLIFHSLVSGPVCRAPLIRYW